MLVCGPLVTSVKAAVAGVPSTLPAASIARTWKMCAPSARAVAGVSAAPGPEQARNASESKRHRNVDAASEEVNSIVGVESSVIVAGAEVIVVSGAVVSTVNSRVSSV
jgi:hypothetical protein